MNEVIDAFSEEYNNEEDLKGSTNSFLYRDIKNVVRQEAGDPPLPWGEYPEGMDTESEEAINYDLFRSKYLGLPSEKIENDLGEEELYSIHDQKIIKKAQAMPEGSQNTDKNWVVASKIVHSYLNPNAKPFGSTETREVYKGVQMDGFPAQNTELEDAEAYGNWGVNFMTAIDYNWGALVWNAGKLNNAPPKVAKAMYYLMETADRDGMLLSNFGKGMLATALDPSTLVGLGTLGLGLAGKFAGKKLSRMAFKEVLKKTILTMPSASTAYLAGEGAVMMGSDNYARQNIKVDAGVQDDINVGEVATSTAIGGAFGSAIDVLSPSVIEGGKRLIAGAGKEIKQFIDNNKIGANLNTGIISARLPTAVNSIEDGIENNLQIGSADILNDTKTLEKNINVIKDYPNLTVNEINGSSEEVAETYIEHMKNNLLWLHDKVPEKTRVRSKLWYDGANQKVNELSKEYNVPANSIAGVFASLSPQKDWFMNASLGMRVIDILTKQQDFKFSKEMLDVSLNGYIKNGKPKKGIFSQPQYSELFEYIKGKKLSELETSGEKAMWLRIYDETYNDPSYKTLTPEGNFTTDVLNDDGKTTSSIAWNSNGMIAKAIDSFYSGGDSKVLSPLMGGRHKVRSFYNNIINPKSLDGSVTIDTHAVAGATLRPVSGNSTIVHHNFGTSPEIKKRQPDWNGAVTNSAVTGVKGSYGLYAEAYRRAGAERGLLPREIQSITWEAVRGLYTKGFKQNDANIEKIDNLWYQYRDGKLTLDEVRNGIEQQSGGINKPQWED